MWKCSLDKFNRAAPQNIPSTTPHCRRFSVLNGPGHRPLGLKTCPRKFFLSPTGFEPKI